MVQGEVYVFLTSASLAQPSKLGLMGNANGTQGGFPDWGCSNDIDGGSSGVVIQSQGRSGYEQVQQQQPMATTSAPLRLLWLDPADRYLQSPRSSQNPRGQHVGFGFVLFALHIRVTVLTTRRAARSSIILRELETMARPPSISARPFVSRPRLRPTSDAYDPQHKPR
jgi:hypothetical protein